MGPLAFARECCEHLRECDSEPRVEVLRHGGREVVEILLGLSLLTLWRFRANVGLVAALFFVAIFPGNINQFLNRIDAFGLNTDVARGVRLLFQPVLVLWALWSTGALRKRMWRTGRT